MPSKTLDALRAKYPKLKENSDEEITLALGKKYPKLAEQDPDFAKDLELYDRGSVGGFVEDFGKSFTASVLYDTSTAAYGVLETIAKPFSEEWTKNFRELSDQAAEMAQDLREEGKIASGLTDASFDRGVDQDSFGSKLGSGAGSLVPIIATGGGASMLGASSVAASRAALALSGLQSYGSTYQSARKSYEDQGFSEEEAATKAMAPAALQGLLDLGLTYAGGKIAGKFGLGDLEGIGTAIKSGQAKGAVDSLFKGSGIGKIVGGALVEGGIEEAPSSFIGQYLIARNSYNPDVTYDQAINEALDSFFVGSVLGGTLGVTKYRRPRKTPEEEAQRNTLRETSPRVADKLDQRDSVSQVLPSDAETILEKPESDFQKANRDTPMGGNRPVSELPELPSPISEREAELEASRRQQIEAVEAERVREGEEIIREDVPVPDTMQVSELAEAKVVDQSETEFNRKAANRQLDLKAEEVTNSLNQEDVEATLDRIEAIDANLAALSGAPKPQRPTAEQLKQMQDAQLAALPQAEPEAEASDEVQVDSDTSVPEQPAVNTLKAGGQTFEVEGEIDAKTRGTLRKAINSVRSRFGSTLGTNKIAVTKMDSGAGVASAARSGVSDTIFIDLDRLSESSKNKRFDLAKAIEEEVIHNLDGQALRSEYLRGRTDGSVDDGVSLQSFIESKYQQIADNMTQAEREATQKNYGDDLRDDIHMSQEFVRQLIQKKHTGEITENAKRNTFIRDLLEAIQRAFVGIKQASKAAREHVQQVESFLLDAYQVEVNDAVTTEEKSEAKKRQREAAEVSDVLGDAEAIDNAYSQIDKAIKIYKKGSPESDRDQDVRQEAVIQFNKQLQRGDYESFGNKPPFKYFSDIVRGKYANQFRSEQRRLNLGGELKAEEVSVDAPVNEDSGETMQIEARGGFTELTPAGETSVDLLKKQQSAIGLTNRDIEVYEGMLRGERVTDLAGERGVTKGAISQAQKAVIEKIQAYSLREDADPEFAAQLYQALQESARSRKGVLAGAAKPSLTLLDRIFSVIPDRNKILKVFSDPLKRVADAVDDGSFLNIHRLKIEKDGYINAVMNEVAYRRRDLAKAIEDAYGKPTDKQLADINAYLNGQTKIKLKEGVANVVDDMRSQIDALSRYLISKNYVSEELAKKITENLNVYLARSYRIFDDPTYVDNIDQEVKEDAINFIKNNLLSQVDDDGNAIHSQTSAREQAEQDVEDLLSELSAKEGRENYLSGKLGSKDVSLFKKKNNKISKEILALMGEYKDPEVNYARSISRMAHYAANSKFLNDVLKAGEGRILFSKDDPRRRGIKTVQIGGDDKTYGPLAGLYTTPEFLDTLQNYEKIYQAMPEGALGVLAKLNIYTKGVKTVGSGMTHVRNAIGQPFFLALNGHLDPTQWTVAKDALAATWADAVGTGGKVAQKLGADKSMQAYYNKMTRLGLVGEEVTTAELKRVLKEYGEAIAESKTPDDALNKGLAKTLKVIKKGGNSVIRAYKASDEIGKIMAFELEKAKLKKLPNYAGKPEAEIERIAAERTRGGLPTYSEIPPAIQRLRMQPVVGPFMSFAYESIRTQANNIKYAMEELNNGNKAYAFSRLGGAALTTAVYSATFKLASYLLGVGLEEQDDFRSLLPDYEKDGAFLMSRDEDGKINYINVSYNNPYSTSTDALMSLFGANGMQSEKGILGHVVNSMASLFDPFTSETIIADALIDLRRNTDSFGNKVINYEGSGTEVALDFADHLVPVFLPGTVERAWRRWFDVALGRTLPSGEATSLVKEIGSELTGLRLRTVDYRDKLNRTSYGNQQRINDANKIFNKIAGNRGTVSSRSMLDAYDSANRSRYNIFKEVLKQVNAARLSGVKDVDIMTALSSGGMTKDDVQHILRGQYRPMNISQSIIKSARSADHPIPLAAIEQIKRKYNRRPLDE